MHVSTVEGHHHLISPLTTDSTEDILTSLFGKEDDIVVTDSTVQGEDFHARIELLSDYVDSLPEGRDKDFFASELARPGWADNKIGKIIFKILLLTRIIKID